MFDSGFDHLLSYGATDHNTLRAVRDRFDGVVVPGTIAAFQRAGTGGFVGSLSAAESQTQYVIDPRTPLFQQPLPVPKRSHVALAELLNTPALVSVVEPSPADFTEDVLRDMATGWARFNYEYAVTLPPSFQKYADVLNEPGILAANAQPPAFVLPPYFVSRRVDHPYWQITKRLRELTDEALEPSGLSCAPVVACYRVGELDALVRDSSAERLFIWVADDFSDSLAPADQLAVYGRAIRDARDRGQRLIAIYGGFFTVVLGSVGLAGASHGIGFGESRNWIELPTSGPPPSRYYVPCLHQYLDIETSAQLWRRDSDLFACGCEVCKGELPSRLLSYHLLMRHSVLCRSQEIAEWPRRPLGVNAEALENCEASVRSLVHDAGLMQQARQKVEAALDHMRAWSQALRILAADTD